MAIRIAAKGFTLIEVIITTIIAAIVFLGLGYIMLTTQRHWVRGGREIALQRDLTLSMDWIKRAVRDGERARILNVDNSVMEVENQREGWREQFRREGNNLIREKGGETQVIVSNLTSLSFSWGVRDIGIDLSLGEHGLELTASSAATLRNRFLAAEWLLDENSGMTARDTSPHGNAGAISGATWARGKHGSALSFNGTNNYVRVKSGWTLNLTRGISVEAWVNLQATGGYQSVVEKIDSGVSGYRLGIRSDGRLFVELATRDDFYRVTSTGCITWNEWQAVGFAYDGREIKLYINGQLDSSVGATGNIVPNIQDLYIGAYQASGDWAWGRIDGVRISD